MAGCRSRRPLSRSSTARRPGKRITVLFNPTEYSIERANTYKSTAVPGLGSPLLQFVNGDAATLRWSCSSTTTPTRRARSLRHLAGRADAASGPASTTITALLDIDRDLHAPPPVRFVWGPLRFDAVLEKVGRKVTHVPARTARRRARPCRSRSRNTGRCRAAARRSAPRIRRQDQAPPDQRGRRRSG